MNIWLTQELISLLYEEIESQAPKETGGVLMGLISSKDYVISHIIGPGPNAIHEKYRFIPDHDYQCDKIEKHFRSTSGKEIYLGDWHSHPNASSYLSEQDKITLKDIADFAEAQIARPIMMVIGTEPFEIKCWKYISQRNLKLQRIKIYKQPVNAAKRVLGRTK